MRFTSALLIVIFALTVCFPVTAGAQSVAFAPTKTSQSHAIGPLHSHNMWQAAAMEREIFNGSRPTPPDQESMHRSLAQKSVPESDSTFVIQRQPKAINWRQAPRDELHAMPRTVASPATNAVHPQTVLLSSSPPPTGFTDWWSYASQSIPGIGAFYANVSTGNLVIDSQDMVVQHRGAAILFRRVYNSLSHHDYVGTDGSQISNYGDGWTNSFDAHIATNSGISCSGTQTLGLTIYDQDGTEYDFLPNCSGGYTPPAGQFSALTTDAAGGYELTETDGTVLDFYNPSQASASGGLAGRLRSISGKNFNSVLTFTYSWTNNDSSSSSNLSQIVVSPEYASGTTNSAVLQFADYYVTSCKPPSPCKKLYTHRLLSTLTRPDGTVVGYNYVVSASSAFLSEVILPSANASNGSCIPGQTNCRIQQYFAASDGQHIGSVMSPRGYQTTTDGAYDQFAYNSDYTVSGISEYAVVNPTPNDGTDTPLQSGYSESQTLFRTTKLNRSGSSDIVSDSDNHQTTYQFDSVGRVTSSALSTGNATLTTSAAYNPNNTESYSVDTRGQRTDYAYNSVGDLIAEADPVGTSVRATTLIGYDGFHNVIAYCDPNYVNGKGENWNGTGTPATCTAGSGHTTFAFKYPSYEPSGELSTETSSRGYVTTWAYPTSGTDYGQPLTVAGQNITEPGGTSSQGPTTISPTTTYTYLSNGLISTKTYGVGSTTYRYGYDAANRVTSITDPDNVQRTNTYWPDGNIEYTANATEIAAKTQDSFQYDLDGDLSQETHWFGCTSTSGCSSANTAKYYDGEDRLVEVELPHDSNDYLSYAWLTRYIYDLTQGGTVSLNSSVTGLKAYGNQFATQLYYEPGGASSPSFTTTRGTSFDGANRPIAAFDEASAYATTAISTRTYDTNDSSGKSRAGLLANITNGAGQTQQFDYYPDGEIDSAVGSDGTSFTYSYDPNGNTTSIAQAGIGTETRTYDSDNNVTTVTTPAYGAETSPTTTSYQYYLNDWRSDLGLNTGNAGVTVADLLHYVYRTDGLLSSRTINLGSAKTFAYQYTNAGRITQLTDPATGLALGSQRASAETADFRRAGLFGHSAKAFARGERSIKGNRGTVAPLSRSMPSYQAYLLRQQDSSKASMYSKSTGVDKSDAEGSPIRREVRIAASSTDFVATQFAYTNGLVTSETLPTGAKYSGFTYDLENEVTQYNAYGSLTEKFGYSNRGELEADHFYPSGSSTFTTSWPHFSRQPSLGYMLPTSEDIPNNDLNVTSFFQGDDSSYTSIQFTSGNSFIQGYGWGQDAAHRQGQDRYQNNIFSILGQVTRSYDVDDHLTQWTVPTTDPQTGDSITGWPVPQSNLNLACNATLTSSPALYPPKTTINYKFDPAGHVIAASFVNPGSANTNAQAHWDGGEPLFTTNSSGKVDYVRVGQEAIVSPSGSAEMLDRDFRGRWVLSHTTTGTSVWSPVDPNLQNCLPSSPPAGYGTFTPATVQFAQLSSDTVTDGVNFFGGIRSYDPAAAQWTSTDAGAGSNADPNSQLAYTWNRNNPETFTDPSGLDGEFVYNPSPYPVSDPLEFPDIPFLIPVIDRIIFVFPYVAPFTVFKPTPVADGGLTARDLMMEKRTNPSKKRREQVKELKGTKCIYCGIQTRPEAGHPDSLEMDHNIPVSRGGDNSLENLDPTCRTCNRAKGARTGEEYERSLEELEEGPS